MKYGTLSGLIVGGGSIGYRHAQNLHELGVTISLADPDEAARTRLSDEFDVRTYSQLSEALDSETPDFVVIATPTRFHKDLALEVAQSRCHLFIEKPLSDKMAGIDELEVMIDDHSLTTLVGCNLRFHPEIKKIKKLLEKEVIGEVVAARIEGGSYLPEWFPEKDYRNSYSARTELGGGVILDYIHEINYARWFFGEFDTISAMAGQRTSLEIETNDIASILGETASGTLCEFHLDYIQRTYSRSCHIIGEDGTIRWSWPKERVRWYDASDEEWHTFDRPDDWEMNDMYIKEMEHFLDCIQRDNETTCPVTCGRQDLSIALAARKSAKTGNHVDIKH